MAGYSYGYMESLLHNLHKIFKGDILTHLEDRLDHSHDASMYESVPNAVLEPKDSRDIQTLVKFVHENKLIYFVV